MPFKWDFDEVDNVLTMSTDEVMLRVAASVDDLQLLADVQAADWPSRRTICAGHVLGQPCSWSRSDEPGGGVFLVVGPDDETWQIAMTLPASAVAEFSAL